MNLQEYRCPKCGYTEQRQSNGMHTIVVQHFTPDTQDECVEPLQFVSPYTSTIVIPRNFH